MTFGVSFVISTPAVWLFKTVSEDHSFGHGIAAGGDAAAHDVERLASAIQASTSGGVSPVPATA